MARVQAAAEHGVDLCGQPRYAKLRSAGETTVAAKRVRSAGFEPVFAIAASNRVVARILRTDSR